MQERNRQGRNALICTAMTGHAEIAKALIDAGSPVGVRDQYGMRAADWAAARGFVHALKVLDDASPDGDKRRHKPWLSSKWMWKICCDRDVIWREGERARSW